MPFSQIIPLSPVPIKINKFILKKILKKQKKKYRNNESLCCIPETKIVWYINYMSKTNKQI